MFTFARSPAVFVISPGQVEVSTGGQARSTVARLPIALPESGSLWPAAVRALSDMLGPWVAQRGLAGRRAVVLYDNPTVATRLSSLPGLSDRQACAAARLAALGSLGAGESTALADACEVARDLRGEAPRRHLLAAADRRAALEAVDELFERAGLTLECVLPVEAVLIASLLRDAGDSNDVAHGRLFVGSRQSWLVVSGAGSLLLFRPIGLGLGQLVDVLTRPISLSGSRADFSLTRERAARLLETHGIPEREQVLDASCGLLGQHVLPLLQPILQRLVVELKQSLRFGLMEAQRRELRLSLCGPGAAVRGLASIIGDAVEAPVQVEPSDAARGADAAFEFGLEGDAILRVLPRCPNLLPPRAVARHAVRRFNRAAWAGLAVAAALLAADAQRMDRLIASERQTVNDLSARLDDSQRRAEQAVEARARDAAFRRVRNAVVAAAGTPDLAALLREAALLAGSEIRLIRVDFDGRTMERAFDADGPTSELTLEGYALGPGSETLVADFVDALQRSTLVESASIGSVARVEIDGRAARRFQVRLAPLAAGRGAGRGLVSAGGEEK